MENPKLNKLQKYFDNNPGLRNQYTITTDSNIKNELNLEKLIEYLLDLSVSKLPNRNMVMMTGKLGAVDAFLQHGKSFMNEEELSEYKIRLEKELPEGGYRLDMNGIEYIGYPEDELINN